MSMGGLIALWPRQSGGGVTSGVAARPASTAKGPAQVLAQTRPQLAQASELGMPEESIRVLECRVMKEEAVMKQAQPLGQRIDQARARHRRAVEAGEKAQDAMLKAQANFEQAQQENAQAQLDLHKLMQEVGNASSTSQREPSQIFGSFDKTYRKTCGIQRQDHHQTN